MGQYYKICNPDTEEYFSPSLFGEGVKLMEFGCGGAGSLAAIAVLMAMPSEDERGSWTGASEKHGAWAGSRLVVTGDYADEGRFVPPEHQQRNLYDYISEAGQELNRELVQMLVDVAGPDHPSAAVLANRSDNYFFSAPEGMNAYLDTRQAASLRFESLTQLLAFGWWEPALTPGDMQHNFTSALRYIALKFNQGHVDVQDFEVVVNEDGMRVDCVRFRAKDRAHEWHFPLKVSTVYALLGVK